MLSRSLRCYTKKMVKNINFEIFDRLNINFTSQTRINAYTLIVKKDFQICEREKKYLLCKNYMI